jgi:thioredoxin reductase (NADPH)
VRKLKWDLIIIGGGPAGLSAGIYGVRAELKTLIIESQLPGGQIATAGLVENYLGFPEGIVGMKLAENFKLQAEKAGVQIHTMERVEEVKRKNNEFLIKTDLDKYLGKTMIVATGLRHLKLGVPGEKEFTGKGVSYCFTCDGPLFKGKKVIVVGSGTSAVEAALYLKGLTKDVKMVMKAENYTTTEKIQRTRMEKSGIEVIPSTKVLEIYGNQLVEGVKVKNLKNGEERNIETQGVFVEIGKAPNTAFLKSLGLEMDTKGYIVVDDQQMTNIPGVFAAGDVTTTKVKQVSVAVAQGAIAALQAYKYLKEGEHNV